MKIAIVLPHYHDEGGIERRTTELVRGLMEEGHEVHIHASRWKEALVEATVGAARMHRVPNLRIGSAFKTLSFALAARRATARAGYDIVHSQTRSLGEDVVTAGGGSHRAWYECWLRDAPTSLERWRVRLSSFHRTVMWMENLQYARCRALIANSRFSRDTFLRYHVLPEEKLFVVYNGVNSREFSPGLRGEWRARLRAELGCPAEETVVLHVGAGFFRKGLAELIQAVAQAQGASRCTFRLLVVGGGNAGPYRHLARSLRVDDRVHFVGATAHAERYYAAADLFALLSRFDPFANSTMEALACGLPVLTTATNGVSEILRHGETGFVIPAAADIDGAARCLQILADQDLREKVGGAGRTLVAEQFTWQQTTRKTLEVYGTVLERKRTGKRGSGETGRRGNGNDGVAGKP